MQTDNGCICQGNWREIVKECESLIGKTFIRNGEEFTFFGLVHGDDDYYWLHLVAVETETPAGEHPP